MNFDQNDIFKALLNGQSADELANSFTEALNAAIAIQKKKAEEEAAQAKEKERIADTEKMIAAVFDYCEKYYPEIFKPGLRQSVSAKELIRVMDNASAETLRLGSSLETFQNTIHGLDYNQLKAVEKLLGIKSPKPTCGEKKDPLADFLKSYNLF